MQVGIRLSLIPLLKPEQVRSRRDRWGLSQVELGRLLGYRQAQVAKWERGIQPPHRTLGLALDGLELQLLQEGRPLWDDPAGYRLIKLGTDFYLFPGDREIPKGVKEVAEVYDENGKLPAEYWKFPVVLHPPYQARFHWMLTEPEWKNRARSGKKG